MIILLLGLLSISVIYLVRLLSLKRMRVASFAICTLYIVVIIWGYSLFVFDVASLGFNGSESFRSIIIGSDVYKSFLDLTGLMSTLPDQVLHAISYVAILILAITVLVLVHGTVSIAQAVIKLSKGKNSTIKKSPHSSVIDFKSFVFIIPVLRLNCRMNC